MAKVVIPSDDLLFFRSLGRAITLQRRRGGIYAVKSYRGTKKRSSSLEPFYWLIYTNQKNLWDSLPDGEKDNWNSKGQKYGMTGLDLYIQEGWKANLNAVYGVGKYGQSYYGAGIT